MQNLRDLSAIDNSMVGLIGGKAASLGEMIKTGINVPPGFVITTETYGQPLSAKLKSDILAAFDALGAERVAVRSSAVAEDSGSASWAGQLETYLNVNREGLFGAIRKCRASIHSKHAQEYAKHNRIAGSGQAVAVIVQAMVDSSVSGIGFTANPVTNNREEIIIESAYGLGEMIVQGMVTPDSWIINKQTGRVVTFTPHRQTDMLVYKNGGNQVVAVPADKRGRPTLNQTQIKQLARTATRIENLYGRPQDIEWAIARGKLYIVQARPITTLRDEQSAPTFTFEKLFTREESLIVSEIQYEKFKEWLSQIGAETMPPSFFRIRKGLLETWFCKESTQAFIDDIYQRNVGEKNYLARNVTRYKQLVVQMHDYEKRTHANSLGELKQYLALFGDVIVPLHVIFFTPLHDGTPRRLLDLALKIRGQDAVFDNSDLYIKDSLSYLYPACAGIESFIGLQDLDSPEPAILKKRENNFFWAEGEYLITNFDSFKTAHPNYDLVLDTFDPNQKTITGAVAFEGRVSGRVQVISRKKDIATFRRGNILVAPMTTPHYLPAMKQAIAFVTDEGGVTCHAAIVAREMKTPCIIGTRIATEVLQNGDLIEVDAYKGVIRIKEKIELMTWQHYLTRPYSLLGVSIWHESYNSSAAMKVFGMRLPLGLYVEEKPGVVRQYRRPEDFKAFKACFEHLLTDELDRLRQLLDEAEQLNIEAEKLLAGKGASKDLAAAIDFHHQLFARATVLPNWALEAMDRLKLKDRTLKRRMEALRAISLYPAVIRQIIVPLATQELEKRRLRHTKEVVNYLTQAEMYTASQELIDERLSIKVQDLRYYFFFDGETSKLKWLDGSRELIEELESIDLKKEVKDGINGLVAYQGKITGKAVLVLTADDLAKKVSPADILVMISSNPQFNALIYACGGIVTDEGGVMSHAAILAREYKKPCIIGTKHATTIINDGDLIEVDARTGKIFILERA